MPAALLALFSYALPLRQSRPALHSPRTTGSAREIQAARPAYGPARLPSLCHIILSDAGLDPQTRIQSPARHRTVLGMRRRRVALKRPPSGAVVPLPRGSVRI